MTYEIVERLRIFSVAFIITGAYSLTLGSNILIGILAQLLWMVTQFDFCCHVTLAEARNILIQFLFLVILLAELKNYIKSCQKQRRLQVKSNPQVNQEQSMQVPDNSEEQKNSKQNGSQNQKKKNKNH